MQRMNVKEILSHPNFSWWTGNNDFALLKLQKAVDYCAHPNIRPICLPADTNEKFAGVEAILTGWGRTSEGGPPSSSLLDVTVKVLSSYQCKRDYSGPSLPSITSKMLCAKVEGGGKDACQVIIPQTGGLLQ